MVPPAPRPARRGHRPTVVAATALAATVLAGCATGARARLAPERSVTGDAAADAVLGRVVALGDAVYTAAYAVHVPFDGRDVASTVTQAAPDRRVTTIGDVRYVVDADRTRTCHLDTGRCSPDLDPAAVSDVQMSADFFGTGLAARVRRDAALAAAPPVASTEQLAGRTATCVTIPLPAPTSSEATLPASTYCVFDDGVLARLESADIEVVLTSYSPEADEAQFTT